MDGVSGSPISNSVDAENLLLLGELAKQIRAAKNREEEQSNEVPPDDKATSVPEVLILPEVSLDDDVDKKIETDVPNNDPKPVVTEFTPPQIPVIQKKKRTKETDLVSQLEKLSISDRPKKTRQIIRGSDVVAERLGEIMDLVTDVDEKIAVIRSSLKSMSQDLWWRGFVDCTAIKTSSKKMKGIQGELAGLEARMQDLWEQVAIIKQNTVIPDIFKRLQHLEVSFDLVRESCSQKRAILKSKAFGETYVWYKGVSKCLMGIKKDCGEENVQLLMDLFEEDFYKIVTKDHQTLPLEVRQEVKNLHKEAIWMFLQAMSFVAKNTPEAIDDDITERWGVIDRQLSENQLCSSLHPESSSVDRLTISDSDVQQVSSLKKIPNDKFCFTTDQYFSSIKWLCGYHGATWKIVEDMQSIAKGILGFGIEVEESLRNFIEGKFVQKPTLRRFDEEESSDSATALEQVYKKHCEFYLYFERRLEAAKKELFNQELDGLVFNVIEYSFGLANALLDIRNSLNLLKKFHDINDEYKDIITSQISLFNYLNPVKTSGDIGETSKIESFYFSSAKFQSIKDKYPEGHFSDDDRFIRRAKETIEATLVEKGKGILDLTKQEAVVWHCVTGQKPLDGLYGPLEKEEGLPVVIRSYIEKCITELMFYTENKYDQKINIFIYILSTKDMYKQQWMFSRDKHVHFRTIVDSYLKSSGVSMCDDSFEGISDVFLCIHKAALRKQRDPLAHGEAWQKLFDFYHKRKEGWSLEKNSLVAIAYKELCEVAVEKDYVRIYFDRGFSLVEKEFKAEVLDFGSLEKADIGLIYRLLGYCIWGSDMEIRKSAHEFIDQLLTQESFLNRIEQNDQEAKDLKSLIHKNTIQKILRGNYRAVRKPELEMLRRGPIKECLENKGFNLKSSEIFLVILWLVQLKDIDIANDIIKSMGQEAFEASFNGPVQQFFSSMHGFWQSQMMGSSMVFGSFQK